MTVYRWSLFGIRNISNKLLEKVKTRILCFFENRVVFLDNVEELVEPEELQMTSQHGAYALHVG